jgi:hypothetical protein
MEGTSQFTSHEGTSGTGGAYGSADRALPSEQQWKGASLALVGALERRWLIARVRDQGAVWVRNPAGDPDSDNPRSKALSPRLQQEVVCRLLDGSPWWLWAWSGSGRNSPADLEPLCPAADVDTAADRIAHVLAVPFGDGADGARP